MAVKLGLVNANIGPPLSGTGTIMNAQLAEQLGLASIWVADHVAVPRRIQSRYPYDPSGQAPVALTDNDYPDPLIWLAYSAAVTSRIRLATGVIVAALRNPLMIAKQTATLDRLSGRRLVLGVGIGWLAEEFTTLGVAFDGRGHLLESHIQAMRELWAQDVATVHNNDVDFDEVISLP